MVERASISSGTKRRRILVELTRLIVAALSPRPLRVAIDGIDASGKTTLRQELNQLLRELDRSVMEASIDSFHKPRSSRYSLGRLSPKGYYQDSFDYCSIVRDLLEPLGPGGSRLYRRGIFNYRLDKPDLSPLKQAANDEILLFDGVFLMRPEIRNYWDFTIIVHVPFDTALERATGREKKLASDAGPIRHLYLTRYFPAQRLYLEECEPYNLADVILINNPIENPKLKIVQHDLC